MKRQLFKTAVLIRIFSLLMGCSSTAVMHNGQNSTTPARRNVAVRALGVSHSVNLKGKGTEAEVSSEKVTSRKLESWDVTAQKVQEVSELVEQAAVVNNIPANLIYGVIWVESRFNPGAKSVVGARGLMQLMPKTAKYLAECIGWSGRVDAEDPEFNIAAGSYYVARLIKQFDGDVDLALAAYNAGPGNIAKWMKNTGLPKVSIEYYTMVQTAARYFGPELPSFDTPVKMEKILPKKIDLDKLGLAILIAGLSDKDFGMERKDVANPFDESL